RRRVAGGRHQLGRPRLGRLLLGRHRLLAHGVERIAVGHGPLLRGGMAALSPYSMRDRDTCRAEGHIAFPAVSSVHVGALRPAARAHGGARGPDVGEPRPAAGAGAARPARRVRQADQAARRRRRARAVDGVREGHHGAGPARAPAVRARRRVGWAKPIGPRGDGGGPERAAAFARGATALAPPEPVPVARAEALLAAGRRHELMQEAVALYERAAEGKDVVVVEGLTATATHPELDAINAQLAQAMDAQVVLVAALGESP